LATYIGVDFSGGARPWRSEILRPTVWLSFLQSSSGNLKLIKLLPVQALNGAGTPFDRLVRLLVAGEFEAAAIDAPFSLPARYMPSGGHAELLQKVRALPNGIDRPFPRGRQIVELGESIAIKNCAKPLRVTEAYWTVRGVNTRSTMWAGPRGGAPFAAACLRLLEQTGRPCWPWTISNNAMLVEAFPAAQLIHWGLPFQGYSGLEGSKTRTLILKGLRQRLSMTSAQTKLMYQSDDALDATIAAFGAVAAATGRVFDFKNAPVDGFISIAE
jgi:Protein of unknown function (DUF429)